MKLSTIVQSTTRGTTYYKSNNKEVFYINYKCSKKRSVKKPAKSCCPTIVNKQINAPKIIVDAQKGANGSRGPVGLRGPRGLTGPRGLRGLRGLTGSPGLDAGGAIIPYASGISAVELASLASGAINTVGLVGFGSTIFGINPTGINIDDLAASGFAFSVPRDGTITSISAVFSNVVTTDITAGTATIKAQLYRASTANNTFAPIPGAEVILPSFSGLLALGGVVSDISPPLAIAVSEEDRLLMVFSVTSSGFGVAVLAIGFVNAGVSIT